MGQIGWIDSHAHLVEEDYKEDLQEVLNRCKESGMQRILVICLSFEELEKGFELQKQERMIDLAFGFFPTHFEKLTEENKKKFENVAQDPRIVAIGEIGLDYYWESDPAKRELQKEALCYQIDVAKKVNKPVLIHSRDAAKDTVEVLRETEHYGVLHCYSYGVDVAKELVSLGYLISLAGPLTFKNARVPKEVAQAIPLDHLLIETDCPYLTPEPCRGQRNEPKNVAHIGEFLSGLKEIPIHQVKEQLWMNYQRIFLKKN